MANVISIRIEADGSAAIVGMDGVADAGDKMGKSVGGTKDVMESSWQSMAKGVAVGNLLTKAFEMLSEKAQAAGQYIKESAYYAARVETLGVAMHVVGNNAGYTAAQMDTYSERVEKMGITTESARQSLTMIADAQMDATKAAELARVAQDAAVIDGINSSEAFQRMTHGIRSGELEILRTIGINVSFERSYAKTAKQLGINTDQLTEHQKVLARQNAVMEYGVNIQGVYDAAMESTGKKVTSLQRYYDNAKLALGEAFSPALGILIDNVTMHLNDLLKWLKSNGTAFEELAKNIASGVNAILHPIDAMTGILMSPFIDDSEQERYNAAADKNYKEWVRLENEKKRMKLQAAATAVREADDRKRLAEQQSEQEVGLYNRFVDAFNGRIRAVEVGDTTMTKHQQEIAKVRGEYEKLREEFPKQISSLQQLERYELQELKTKQRQQDEILATTQSIKDMEESMKGITGLESAKYGLYANKIQQGLSAGNRYGAPAKNSLLDTTERKPAYSLLNPGTSGHVMYGPDLEKERQASIDFRKADMELNKELIRASQSDSEIRLSAQNDQLNLELENRISWAEKHIAAEDKKWAYMLKAEEVYNASKKRLEEENFKASANSLQNSMGQIGNMLMQGGKEQFEAGKKISKMMIAIDTARAASAAFAGAAAAGGPWGVAMGVAAGIAAMAVGTMNMARLDAVQYQARAMGGPVSSGTSYLVGERGPEIFTPGASGQITSNDKLNSLGGQSISVTPVFQISTGVSDTVRAEIMRFAPHIVNLSVGAVKSAMRAGQFQGVPA